MGVFYEKLVRRGLFQLDSEHAHELGIDALTLLGALPPLCRLMERWNGLPGPVRRPVEAFGLKFPNAVGLAAGFDKNARAWPAAAALGFGHVEIGTVTALRQPGNDRPRVFRYPQSEAVINRMGFNNHGGSRIARVRDTGGSRWGSISVNQNLPRSTKQWGIILRVSPSSPAMRTTWCST